MPTKHMTDMRTNYYADTIADSFVEHGISATVEQINAVASDVAHSAEMYSEAMGYTSIPNPQTKEIKELKTLLQIEREKVVCPECRGKGRIISYGGTLMCDSQCWKCRGEGKVKG